MHFQNLKATFSFEMEIYQKFIQTRELIKVGLTQAGLAKVGLTQAGLTKTGLAQAGPPVGPLVGPPPTLISRFLKKRKTILNF